MTDGTNLTVSITRRDIDDSREVMAAVMAESSVLMATSGFMCAYMRTAAGESHRHMA